MRTWGEWNSKERALFERVHREAMPELHISEFSEVKGLVDIEMFCRPLTDGEIERVEHILDSAVAGVLSREAGGIDVRQGLNEAGRRYYPTEGKAA